MRKITYAAIASAALVISVCLFQLSYLFFHRESTPKDFNYSYQIGSLVPVEGAEILKPEMEKILSQKFFYLGRGTQMTAFVSQDGVYVIKFFNPRRFVREEWFYDFKKLKRLCSLKWFSNAYFQRKKRLNTLAERYRLAFHELKEESGLVYIHINSSTNPNKVIEVFDRDERRSLLDLNSCPFILQKNVDLAIHYLQSQLKLGNIKQCKNSLESLADLFISRAQKGFSDRNQSLEYNYGFYKGQAVQLDLGRIVKQDGGSAVPVDEIKRIFSQLEASITEFIPELQTVLSQILEQKLLAYQQATVK